MKNNLTTSENFTNLMISFEKEVLKGYLDPVGIPTIGIGHVILKGEPYKVGKTISRDESRRLFKKDTQWAVNAVNRLITRSLNQNQFDALVSLVFNIGETGFSRSTVLRETNRGNFNKAAQAFSLWNKAKGKILKGLVRRRKIEAELFLKPNHNNKTEDIPSTSVDKIQKPTSSNDFNQSICSEIVNYESVETKTIEPPQSDGSTATATKLTIAGLAIPPALAAIIQTIQEAITNGFVDAKTIGDGVIVFLTANYKYVFVGIGTLVMFLLVKKLCKQITLWLEMYFTASQNYNDVKVKKGEL